MPSWDDWVPQDRIRKMNEDNKALAANLKFEMDKLLRPKAVAASNKKKAAGSDLSSNRGSEERNATPITGRGQKRGRDYEIEKVREQLSSKLGDYWSSSPGPDGKPLALEDEEPGLRRSKRLKANPARWSEELLASTSRSASPIRGRPKPEGKSPDLEDEETELRRSKRLKANPARGAKELLASSSKLASPTMSHPESCPSKPKCRRAKAPMPLPAIAPRHSTNVSRVQLLTPAQMKQAWTASRHHTASSCFDWDGLYSDIPYEMLDAAERQAEFPPPGYRLPDKEGNPKPPLPRRRLPPIKPHKHFPRKHLHLYVTMRRLIGLVGDDDPPAPPRSKRFVRAGIPVEENTPEDLVDRVKKQRDYLTKRSKGRVQFTNRANDF